MESNKKELNEADKVILTKMFNDTREFKVDSQILLKGFEILIKKDCEIDELKQFGLKDFLISIIQLLIQEMEENRSNKIQVAIKSKQIAFLKNKREELEQIG